jgi:hypothetical protein
VTTIGGTDRIYFVELDGEDSQVAGSIVAGQMGSIVYTYNAFSGIELNADGSMLAACITFDDELLLVDTASQSEITRVPVGDFPFRVAFSPDGLRAYVTNSFGDDVSVVRIRGSGSYVEAVVPGIDFPLTIDVDDGGAFVYVGSFSSSTPSIHVIDTTTASVVATLPLTSEPRAAHLSPTDAILYVATTGGELVRIDAAGPGSSIIDSVALSGGPSALVFSEMLGTAIVAQPVVDGVDVVRFVTPGDFDGDTDIDLADFTRFQICFTGAGGGPVDCRCAAGDFEPDGDVDAEDHADFAAAMTGPGS